MRKDKLGEQGFLGGRELGDPGNIPLDDLLDLFLNQAISGETEYPAAETTAEIKRIAWQHGQSTDSEETDRDETSVGQQLGSYCISHRMKSGGMGDVYRARHTVLDRDVALKTLRRERALDPASIDRFQREMRALASINHPNVVIAYDGDIQDDTVYLAMELVEGVDLKQLAVRRPLDIGTCCEIIRQAALGLETVHQAGVIHRDIKPSNIMLTREGVVKVVDFGLAMIVQEGSDLTSQHAVVGTESYMSPEQIFGHDDIDHRTDLYSLGRTLQYLLASVRSQSADGSGETIPGPLSNLILSLLETNRDSRVSSAAEVADQLAAFCTTIEVGPLFSESAADGLPDHETPAGPPTQSWAGRSDVRRPGGKGSLLFALATIAAVTGLLYSLGYFPFSAEDSTKPDDQRQAVAAGTGAESVADIQAGESAAALGEDPVQGADFDEERRVSEWIIHKGGIVRINYRGPTDWTGKTITLLSDLPASPFLIQVIEAWDTDISSNELTRVKGLSAVEGFSFSGPGITDRLFAQFQPGWDLKWLYLPCPEITDDGIALLEPYRESIRSLSVVNSKVSDKTLKLVVGWPKLRELLVGNTGVSNAGMEYMPQIPELVSLDVSATTVGSEGIRHIAECRQLRKLKVANLELEDEDLDVLATLDLTNLDVSGTSISTGAIQQYIESHPDCVVVY